MHKITDIQSQQKRKGRFSLFVDGKYSFSLPDYEVFDNAIKVGQELEPHELDKLKQLSEDSKVFELAYLKALRRPHSEKEMRDYFKRKFVEQDLADNIVKRLVDKDLIDDQSFAEHWFSMRQKSGRSTSYIRGELRSKGVDQKIIESLVAENQGDGGALEKLIAKKAGRYDDERKFIQYLQRKGFRYDEIKAALARTSEG